MLAITGLLFSGSVLFSSLGVASPGQVVDDLGTVTANDLANALVGSGVTVSNVAYTGSPRAAGTFSGLGEVGFDEGIALGSGKVKDVVGPNDSDSKTTAFGRDGDDDLDDLAAGPTLDASVLEFDFVPSTDTVSFNYVFSSEEYSEFANTQFNDVFGFFVNGENCALTPDGEPVSINTINGGNPPGTNAQRPELYRDNGRDPATGDSPLDIEPDGLTVVLTCDAQVTPDATNTMKLAIADVSDGAFDSNVFLQAGSFTSVQSGAVGDGLVMHPSGSASTSFSFDVARSDADLSGSASVTSGQGMFDGNRVTALTVTGNVAKFTVRGTWQGMPGHRLVVTATDATPDRIRLFVRKAGLTVYSASGPLASGFIMVTE